MSMPEAAMNKNNRFVFWQYYIRFARHILYMQPVPVPVCMQKPPHQHFRLGILALNAAHIIAPRFLRMYICHQTKLSCKYLLATPCIFSILINSFYKRLKWVNKRRMKI
jgi:hypothetical protein